MIRHSLLEWGRQTTGKEEEDMKSVLAHVHWISD